MSTASHKLKTKQNKMQFNTLIQNSVEPYDSRTPIKLWREFPWST